MHVVIVEDTPVNLAVMQSLVSQLNDCTCHVFAEPNAALQWCLNNTPDLIIVDYQMPGMNGLQFIRHCREAGQMAETPILMVTGAAEKAVRYEALDCGATDFLTKPIDRNEFLSRVRNMLTLRRSMVAMATRATELAAAVSRATAEIHQRESETVMRLAKAAEFRDPDTGAHILRMAHYSRLIARAIGLSGELQEMILTAAPMHDVGKLGTPDHILLKPGKLSAEELEIMKQHALIGYEILKDSASPVVQMAALIALSHHEKFDGSGYPHGNHAEEIPIVGRIVAVADVFDALTSARPYKPAWDLDRARNWLSEGRGRHFDPNCVDAFLHHWTEVLQIRDDFQD